MPSTVRLGRFAYRQAQARVAWVATSQSTLAIVLALRLVDLCRWKAAKVLPGRAVRW
jgi:hypothetical protein